MDHMSIVDSGLDLSTAPRQQGGPSGFERMPPQDVLAEQCALGAMLLSKDAVADVSENLRGADFYRPAHEMIYDAVLDLFGRGEPADPVTVADVLGRRGELNRVGGAPYLHTLVATVPTAASAAFYARIVRDKAILRRLVEAGTKIASLGYAGEGGDVDEIVNIAQAEVYAVTDRQARDDYRPLSEVMQDTVTELEEMEARPEGVNGVPTGFRELDQLTNGLHPGQMIVIAARPAMGKSTVGLDIARNAAIHHHMPTVIFSLEMSRTEITTRLISAEAGIKLQALRNGRLQDTDWQKIARVLGQTNEAPLFIDDSPNMTLPEIRAKCRRLKQQHGLKLVVLDYLQLMSSGKRVESRQQEVSEFSRALKLLAKELEVPVIAISQLNRGPEQRTDKKPQMSDLRESGCLTADTRVMRADTGVEVSLGELFTLGARDVPVWSVDESHRYVVRHLTHVFRTGTRPVFRLTLASGKRVRATANHPFLTYEGWTPLAELAPGSRLAVPRHVPAPQQLAVWEAAEVVLLAHLVGDGSVVPRQPLRYASLDEANLAAVTEAARHFGVSAVRGEHPAAHCTSLRLPSPHRPGHDRRNPVAEWLDGLGLLGLRPHEKFVPSPVFQLPKAQVALFLRHLWATDGSVTVRPDRSRGRISYACTSRRLVDDVSRLLLRFGISSRLGAAAETEHRQLWTLDVSGVDDQRRFLQEIGVHGARGRAAAELLEVVRTTRTDTNVDTVALPVWDDVKALLAERRMTPRDLTTGLGTAHGGSTTFAPAPSRHRLARVAELLDSVELEILATNDLLWDTVRSIEPDGVEPVFDATVVGTHNFIADGIAVHNSIEQDADMVMLLHREDAYDKDNRPGEADFIIAKHRNGPTDTITVVFQGHYSRFGDMARG